MTSPLRHEDVCTLLRNKEDVDILTRKLFDVNLRLYRTSPRYREIVQSAAAYILHCAQTTRLGYKKPHGFSGANAGIPFNIIATPEEVMLNPRITSVHGGSTTRSTSNCGSLLLPEPIPILRYQRITFEFWDLDLNKHERTGPYFTIQHEVDHNNGVLITGRRTSP